MVIAKVASKNLRLGAQPAIRRAVNDAITIALKWSPVRMLLLRVLAPLGMHAVHRPRSEQSRLARLDSLRNRKPSQA
jgi:hypothetical protein